MDRLAFLIMLTSFYMFYISIKMKETLLIIISFILFGMSIFLFLFEFRMI